MNQEYVNIIVITIVLLTVYWSIFTTTQNTLKTKLTL